ncbi:hypothetical protein [Lysinibacillus sp. NPDC086135]|uniref:hypothetical protein n=1 Tax=Lysinibacillus sp. NPDC086135 TaxID=3364130 RepID=UPI0038119A7B
MIKSRKERKLEAKQNGVPFVPQYNGNGVISAEDFYGKGNERFNNKFVQFHKPLETPHESSEEALIEDNEVEALSDDILITTERTNDEMIEAELIVETPKKKKKKGKFKKALKKLFNK